MYSYWNHTFTEHLTDIATKRWKRTPLQLPAIPNGDNHENVLSYSSEDEIFTWKKASFMVDPPKHKFINPQTSFPRLNLLCHGVKSPRKFPPAKRSK